MNKTYWLFKTEPETFSFSDLLRDQKTNWNGVRNFQARNYLREIVPGDHILIYHSGKEKSVVGLAEAISLPYPDGEWVQVDIQPCLQFQRPISLSSIKTNKDLNQMLLIKQSRLSVMPLQKKEFETLLALGTAL